MGLMLEECEAALCVFLWDYMQQVPFGTTTSSSGVSSGPVRGLQTQCSQPAAQQVALPGPSGSVLLQGFVGQCIRFSSSSSSWWARGVGPAAALCCGLSSVGMKLVLRQYCINWRTRPCDRGKQVAQSLFLDAF